MNFWTVDLPGGEPDESSEPPMVGSPRKQVDNFGQLYPDKQVDYPECSAFDRIQIGNF